MIIDNIPNFIQRIVKKSEDDFYIPVHGCHQCGYAGNLHRHASYYRNVICEEVTARIREPVNNFVYSQLSQGNNQNF